MPAKKKKAICSAKEWAERNRPEWRMRFDVPDEELRAALAWEVAREHMETFESLARERASLLGIEEAIDEIACRIGNETATSDDREKLKKLKELRKSVPDKVLLEPPLNRIWSAREFPTPWLSLPKTAREDLAMAFSRRSATYLHTARIAGSSVHELAAQAQEAVQRLLPYLPDGFDLEDLAELADRGPEVIQHREVNGHTFTDVLFQIDWRGNDSTLVGSFRQWLEMHRRHDPDPSPSSIGPQKKKAEGILLGLALMRFKKVHDWDWEDIHTAIWPGGKNALLTPRVRGGIVDHPHHWESLDRAKEFCGAYLAPENLKILVRN